MFRITNHSLAKPAQTARAPRQVLRQHVEFYSADIALGETTKIQIGDVVKIHTRTLALPDTAELKYS